MAATNRFRKIIPKDFSWETPDIQVWQPNQEAWLKVLENQQAKYDTLGQLEGIVPKHLQQDASDVQLYTKNVQDQIKNVKDAFASGDIVNGNRMLRELTQKIKRDWQPGGAADMFQQRLQKYSDIDKRLQETYLDPKSKQYAPELYPEYKKRILIQPYKTDTGYGSITGPTQYQYFNAKDRQDFISDVLKNISADQVALKPGLIPSGVSLQDFFRTGNKEFIDYKKVYNTLLESVPPEMLLGLQVYSEATGVDAIKSFQDQLDAAAKGKAYSKVDYDYQKVTDEVEMAKLQSRLRREEKKEEQFSDIVLRTQIFNSNSGMPEWDNLDINVTDNGKVTTFKNDPGTGQIIGGNELIGGPRTIRKETGQGFKDWIWTQSAPKQLQSIASEFASAIEGMTDKQAYDFIQQKYNEKRQVLSNTDALVSPYTGKIQETWNELLLGTTKGKEGARPGVLFNDNLTTTTLMPGEVSSVPAVQLGRAMGIYDSDGRVNPGAMRHFIENASVLEQVEVPSGVMPSGHKISYIDPNGKTWVFMAGPRSLQEEQLNSDAYKIAQARLNDAVDNFSFQPVHPILKENFPNGIEVDSKDVYTEDILTHRWNEAFKKNLPEADMLRKQLDDVRKNPGKNSFVMKDVRILNPVTKQPVPILDDDEKPVKDAEGNVRYWTDQDINNLVRNTEIK